MQPEDEAVQDADEAVVATEDAQDLVAARDEDDVSVQQHRCSHPQHGELRDEFIAAAPDQAIPEDDEADGAVAAEDEEEPVGPERQIGEAKAAGEHQDMGPELAEEGNPARLRVARAEETHHASCGVTASICGGVEPVSSRKSWMCPRVMCAF